MTALFLKSYKQLFSLLVFSLSLISVESYAATSYHGDSVMTPGGFSTAPVILSGQSKATGNQYTSSIVTEYQTGICPAGLTSNGGSTYNSAQRSITTIYLGTQLVSTTVGSWVDSDIDCIGYQYQTIGCPANYTGSMTQQQKLSTGVGGLIGGGWETISNACVYNPPPFCNYIYNGTANYIILETPIDNNGTYSDDVGNTIYPHSNIYPNFYHGGYTSYDRGVLYVIIKSRQRLGGPINFSSKAQLDAILQSYGINITGYINSYTTDWGLAGDTYTMCIPQSLYDSSNVDGNGWSPF